MWNARSVFNVIFVLVSMYLSIYLWVWISNATLIWAHSVLVSVWVRLYGTLHGLVRTSLNGSRYIGEFSASNVCLNCCRLFVCYVRSVPCVFCTVRCAVHVGKTYTIKYNNPQINTLRENSISSQSLVMLSAWPLLLSSIIYFDQTIHT